MGKGKAGMVSNADRVLITKMLDDETVKRTKHQQGLIDGKPESLAWAKRMGLTHWHSIGFGCGPSCLKDVGKELDPECVNFWSGIRIPHRETPRPEMTSEKETKRKKARDGAVARELRLRKAGLSVDTGRH